MKPHTFITLIFVLLALASPALGQSTCNDQPYNPICLTALNSMLADIVNNKNYYPPSLMTTNFELLSGRFINDLGEYTSCQAQNVSHYITLNFTATVGTAGFPAAIGFCAPIVCSASDISALGDNVAYLFAKALIFNFTVVKVSGCDLETFDPLAPIQADTSSYIVWGILLFVVSLAFMGTFMNAYFEIKDAWRADRKKANVDDLLLGAGQGDNNMSSAPRKRNYKGFFRFIDCFDIRKNFSKIVTVKQSEAYDANLEIFNGLRVFMFMYVVYGHTYIFGTSYVDNESDIITFAKGWWLLIVYAALYAVDAFFFMSGFFVAFLAVGKLAKMRMSIINYVGLCFHRFFRIWPTYAFAVLFFWKVLPYLGSGPVWFQMTATTSLCDNGNVFENLSFLDDFLVSSSNYCYGWGWYLSNDFQMFLITPFFLWLYIRNRGIGKIAILALIMVSWVIALFVGGDFQVLAAPPTTGGITKPQVFVDYYVKPYIRLPPYFFGILLGLMYKEYKENYGFSYRAGVFCRKFLVKWILQIGGFAGMMTVILMIRPEQMNNHAWSLEINNIVRAFQKGAYVLCMAAIILPSLLGEDTLLKRFMSHQLLVPLYRVSFTAYLVHLFWVYRAYYSETASFHFSTETLLYQTIANGIISFVTAFLLSLLVEVPTSNIEGVYLMPKKRGPRPPKKEGGEYAPPVSSGKGAEPKASASIDIRE